MSEDRLLAGLLFEPLKLEEVRRRLNGYAWRGNSGWNAHAYAALCRFNGRIDPISDKWFCDFCREKGILREGQSPAGLYSLLDTIRAKHDPAADLEALADHLARGDTAPEIAIPGAGLHDEGGGNGAIAANRDNATEPAGTRTAGHFDANRQERTGGLAAELEAEGIAPRREIPSPWPLVDRASGLFRGGQLVILAGQEGHGKSLLAMQAALAVHQAGGRFAFLPLEDRKAEWESRALALLSESWLPLDRTAATLDQRKALLALHTDTLAAFAAGCVENPTRPKLNTDTGALEAQPVPPDRVLSWAGRALDRVDAVFIDNFSMVEFPQDGREWQAQESFVRRLVALLRPGKTVCMVAHLRRRSAAERRFPPHSDDLQGAKALGRRAHVVIAVEAHPEAQSDLNASMGPRLAVPHDRTVFCVKARNGPGSGLSFAFAMEQGGRLVELGAIDPRSKRPGQTKSPAWSGGGGDNL
jgi:hypothetical protein